MKGWRERVTRARRRLFVFLLAAILGAFLITTTSTLASTGKVPPKPILPLTPPPSTPVPAPTVLPLPTPESPPVPDTPQQTSGTRIKAFFGQTTELQVADGADSVVVVSPEIAKVEIKSRFALNILGLKRGETILLVTTGRNRHTYILAVEDPPISERRRLAMEDTARATFSAGSGSLTTLYARGSGGTSVLRQNFNYSRKLSNNRTLRVSSDMFKLLGESNSDQAFARVTDYGLNRLSATLDTPAKTIDFLDSQVSLSPLSLNGYTIRGFHLVSKSASAPVKGLPELGLEIFAGFAHPSISFYNNESGKVAGIMAPVFKSASFQVRTGVVAVSPEKNSPNAVGGVITQADVRYAPSGKIFADAEIAYANGDLSWRGRLDVKFSKIGGSAEMSRLARSSPLNSIGAQPGGRKTQSFSLFWRPLTRFNMSGGYNRTSVTRPTNSFLTDFERSQTFADLSYTLSRRSLFKLRYTDQKIETAFPGSLSKFRIETRSFLIGHNARLAKKWSNIIEGRLNFSREAEAGAALENGFSLNEQLRYTSRGTSLTGFASYTHKTPSLTSLIVRNPQLLPPALQAAFALDPAEFIRVNRERLAMLLNGIELPQMRNLDAGARIQKTISRVSAAIEARYNAGEIMAINQKNLYISASVGVRLDGANSLQVNGWKSIGGRAESGLTFSYTHQIGGSGDGFQFSKLFNFSRGKIRGRVFYDLNGNARPDPTEPGISGMEVRIDGKRSVKTDKDGRYEMNANEGNHKVLLISSELGVRLLANTPTENIVALDSGQKLDLNFGMRDFGSISGDIFNDAGAIGNSPGVGGVKIILRSTGTGSSNLTIEQIAGSTGKYEFQNLRPGVYTIEIDPASLPANYIIPTATVSSSLRVEALHTTSYDVALTAQRAVSGTVFIDTNGDGRYTPEKDEPVRGAYVTLNKHGVITDINGAYLFRNLKAGKSEIVAHSLNGAGITSRVLELGVEPVTLRAVDLPIGR